MIAGKARSLKLKTLETMETRPTQDRTKETLFNVLAPFIADCRFLDLFSGSGGIGIEALSRGASRAVFVERNPKAVLCIKENLRFTRLEPDAAVYCTDVQTALAQMDGHACFDCIFMDPPYNQLLEKQALTFLSKSSLIHKDTIIVVEASLQTDFSYLSDLNFEVYKYKKYKTNQHVFIRLTDKDALN